MMFSEQLYLFLLCPTLFLYHLLALEKQGLAPEHQWEVGGSPTFGKGLSVCGSLCSPPSRRLHLRGRLPRQGLLAIGLELRKLPTCFKLIEEIQVPASSYFLELLGTEFCPLYMVFQLL